MFGSELHFDTFGITSIAGFGRCPFVIPVPNPEGYKVIKR
jgi:hypothetical protein